MMCDARLWHTQVEMLASEIQISVADIGGVASIVAIARQILAEAPARFALAGLSMGGIIAFEMWRQASHRIERLALLDTNHPADLPDRRMAREAQLQRVAVGDLESVLCDELKPNYLASCHMSNTELLDQVLTMGLEQGNVVFARQTQALRDRPDSSATLSGISCPTLVLCGDEDALCSPSVHRHMARIIPEARLGIVANCGHLSPMEQPIAVSRALSSWLVAT